MDWSAGAEDPQQLVAVVARSPSFLAVADYTTLRVAITTAPAG
jgi:hypothetical protein